MKKRGIGTLVVVLIIAVVVAVVLFGTDIFSKSTGSATLTDGATYLQISKEANNYIDCVYITEDDGWDVTKKATMQYYDKKEKKTLTITDTCEGDRVIEYHCDNGYRRKRLAICPSGDVCKSGICAS